MPTLLMVRQTERGQLKMTASAISAKRCHLWEHLFHCNIWTQPRVTIQSPNFSHPATKRLTSLWLGVACAPTLLRIVRMCISAHKRPRKRKRQKHRKTINKPIPVSSTTVSVCAAILCRHCQPSMSLLQRVVSIVLNIWRTLFKADVLTVGYTFR